MYLRRLAFWDSGFESGLGHRCLSVVSVVFCQLEVSATDRSLVQRNPTEYGMTEYDLEGCSVIGKGSKLILSFTQLDIGWKLGALFPRDKAAGA